MARSRSWVWPVSLVQARPRCFSSCSTRPSMVVNCENSSTLRPSASISVSCSISSSSLADWRSAWAAGTAASSRGSQQTWRSFSSASRIWICDFARPLSASASRTAFSVASRIVSYRSACAPPRAMRTVVSCFSGNSPATSDLPRRSRNGVTRRRSWPSRSPSPCFSMGVRNTSLKRAWLPRKPGIRKWNRLHSSPRWFSSGVPDRHSRCRVSRPATTCAAWVLAFLMFCASSSTTRCQGWASHCSRSRCSSE